MKRKPGYSVLVWVIGLAMAALACGGSAPSAITSVETSGAGAAPSSAGAAPSAQVAAAEPPTISYSYAYTDEGNHYHVAGLLHNGTSQALTDIDLTLTVTDDNGRNLLTNDFGTPTPKLVFHPLLQSLAPGADSPFDSLMIGATWGLRPTEVPVKHNYTVTVTGYQVAQTTPAKVTIQDLKIKEVPGAPYVEIQCQLVNQDSQAALLTSEAAAMLNRKGEVVATYGGQYKYLLAPAGDSAGNDHIPLQFFLTGSASDTHPQIYLDAVRYPDYHMPKVSFEVMKTFYDIQDLREYHILGTLTNDEPAPRMLSVEAYVYAKDGAYLTVSASNWPLVMASGESLPVDLSDFGSYYPHVSIDHYQIRIEPFYSLQPPPEFVPLETAGDVLTNEGSGPAAGQLTIEGTITNVADKPLFDVTIVIGVYDSHNRLVGAGGTEVGQSEYTAIEGTERVKRSGDIPAGEVVLYDALAQVDPALAGGKFAIKTWAQGFFTP